MSNRRSYKTGLQQDRREFLKRMAVVGGAAALGGAAGNQLAAAREEPPAPAALEKKGYRLTPHIQEYYRTASL
ncbi:MAG: twin-arginine translocation signal domain-containing protein [Gammaproteobacteria bacterium]